MAKNPVASSVTAYIAGCPPDARAALKQVRRLIRDAVPGVTERISYAIPRFDLNGKCVLYMAAWKEHVGVYPITGALAAAFARELKPFTSGKATVRFPLAEPLPLDLIRRIVEFRVREMLTSHP